MGIFFKTTVGYFMRDPKQTMRMSKVDEFHPFATDILQAIKLTYKSDNDIHNMKFQRHYFLGIGVNLKPILLEMSNAITNGETSYDNACLEIASHIARENHLLSKMSNITLALVP